MADLTTDVCSLPETEENDIAVSNLQSEELLSAGTTGILVISQSGEVIATGDASGLSQQGGVQMFTLENSNLVIANLKAQNMYAEVDPHQQTTDHNSVKSILSTVQAMILNRLEEIEQKVESFGIRCQQLEEKLQDVFSQLKEGGFGNRFTFSAVRGRSGTIIVGVPSPGFSEGAASGGGGVQLITLNSEADYPYGSWLGDSTNPDRRVRVPISFCDLENLNKTCNTPEKMALTLLDYLFDRETQARSNLSGNSKHGKKQLDPLKIYAIRCHLMHRFEITDKDWHRIRLNLDSKCRTAFRRKQKGMPLMVKAFKERTPATQHQMEESSFDQDMDLTTVSLSHFGGKTQVIHTDGGDIQVVHATPEQLTEFQQAHQIQIFAGSKES